MFRLCWARAQLVGSVSHSLSFLLSPAHLSTALRIAQLRQQLEVAVIIRRHEPTAHEKVDNDDGDVWLEELFLRLSRRLTGASNADGASGLYGPSGRGTPPRLSTDRTMVSSSAWPSKF